MPAMLKRQRFEDSESKEMEPKGSKRQWLYARGNKEGEDLDGFEDESEEKAIGYVLLPFVALPQKELNRPTDMGKRTKSLNYLV